MKRKKRIIVSLISLAFSISLMMFGVWASTNPTVSITGYVTFNISSSQVSVTGTIIDGYDANGNAIAFLDGRNFHYQDYTDREKTTLEDWSLNAGQPLYFKEDESGVTDIKLKFDFINNSPFYTIAKFENVTATNNVNVTFDQQVIMDIKGNEQSSKSSTITYSVIDNSKTASSDINFTVTFERYLADGQTFAMFQQNFANQKPLTTEEVSLLQAEYDNNKAEKQDMVPTPESQTNTQFNNDNTQNTANKIANNPYNNVNNVENNTRNNANGIESNTNNNVNKIENNTSDNVNRDDKNLDNNNVIHNNISNILRNRIQNLNNTQNQNGTNR